MKTCKIGLFATAVTLGVFLLLIPTAAFCVYMFLQAPLSGGGRPLFAAGAALFGRLTAFAAYRGLYLGPSWAEYNGEGVVFHPSRRERYNFRWEEIPGRRVRAGTWNGGYVFLISLANGRERKVALNHFARGFRDFERTLESAGVLGRIGVTTKEDFRRSAEQIFSQFEGFGGTDAGGQGPGRRGVR